MAEPKARILVVEDDAIIADDLEQRLRTMGYDVVGVAAEGREALRLAHEHAPDLVLTDIQIEGSMDGVQVAEQLVRDMHIAVVFITAFADSATIARARASKPFGYIVKPYSEADLLASVEIALERHRLERRADRAERLLAATLRSIGDGVIATDLEHRITFMNPVAESLTGYAEPEAVGRELSLIYNAIEAYALDTGDTYTLEALKLEGAATMPSRDKVLTSRDGARRYVEDSSAPIYDESNRLVGHIFVFRDVSLRKQHERRRAQAGRIARQRLQDEAVRDALTGLYNRRGWEALVRAEEERCTREGKSAAVLIVDLDDLKRVNDAHGHGVGDEYIARAGAALRRAARTEDVVARLGGDEFAMLVVDCDLHGVTAVLERVQGALHESGIPASVGCATRDFRTDLFDAVDYADKKMYEMKRRRKASAAR